MALAHSPKVVTSNLVFYYDIANTKKSNIGDTTTNLISNGDFSNGTVGWGNYALSTVPFVTTVYDFPGSISSAKSVLQCNCLGSIHGGGNYGGFSSSAPALSSGTTYTVSFSARSLSGNMTFVFSNQNGSGDNSNLAFNSTITGDWRRYTKTASLDLVKGTLYFYNQSVSSGTFQISDIQIEAKSTATTFTSGSRSSTQSVLDIMGRNTVTVSSLTYASDGSFSFNGSSNYITATPQSSFNMYCLDVWYYNNNAIPNNDTVIGGPSTYQTMVMFNNAYPCGVNLGAWTGGMTNEAIQIWTGNSSVYAGTYNRDYVASGWHNTVFNWNGSQYDIWTDGVKTTTYTMSGGATLQNITSLQIGYSSPGYYFNGKIAAMKCYSSQLTNEQVLQNFNAQRGRYGI